MVREQNRATDLNLRRFRATSVIRRCCAVVFLAAVLGGCVTPEKRGADMKPLLSGSNDAEDLKKNAIDPTKIEVRDDIVRVIQFWPQTPWLFESDRVIGFTATIYFISGETMKGAFVSRMIYVWVNELAPRAGGGIERKLLHGWELDPQQAMGFRVNRRSVLGYRYGFPLRWPTQLEMEGRLIEIQFGYERGDGKVVLSSAKRFRVPIPNGFVPSSQEAAR